MATALILFACNGGKDRRTWFGLHALYCQHKTYTGPTPTRDLPVRAQDLIPDKDQLSDNAEDIQVHSVCEQKIPQLQNLRQGWCTRAYRRHTSKSIDVRIQPLTLQVMVELRITNLQYLIDQLQSMVYAFHASADVARHFCGEELVQRNKGLDFRPSSVEERSGEDVHALHIPDIRIALFAGTEIACGIVKRISRRLW